MAITQDMINDAFCKRIPYPNGNVLTTEGFQVLADWSEQQEWWLEFTRLNGLGHCWRESYMGNPCMFALTVFRFSRSWL